MQGFSSLKQVVCTGPPRFKGLKIKKFLWIMKVPRITLKVFHHKSTSMYISCTGICDAAVHVITPQLLSKCFTTKHSILPKIKKIEQTNVILLCNYAHYHLIRCQSFISSFNAVENTIYLVMFIWTFKETSSHAKHKCNIVKVKLCFDTYSQRASISQVCS